MDTNYTLGMPKRAPGVPRGMEGSPPTGIVCPNLVYSLSIHIPQNNSAQCLTQAVRSCLIRKRQKHIREQTEKKKKKKKKLKKIKGSSENAISLTPACFAPNNQVGRSFAISFMCSSKDHPSPQTTGSPPFGA